MNEVGPPKIKVHFSKSFLKAYLRWKPTCAEQLFQPVKRESLSVLLQLTAVELRWESGVVTSGSTVS